MRYRPIKNLLIATGCCLAFGACNDALDLEPKNEFTSEVVYDSISNYVNVLAKLYAGYAVTGQQGGGGRPDVLGIDEGASSYFRAHWILQELPTDEAVLAWVNDAGVAPLNLGTWSASNAIVQAMYYRIYYQVALANEFIRETSDEQLNARGISVDDQATARQYRTEARFLRALSYYHALDLFGNVPFLDETDGVGVYFPEQISRADLFDYVEAELLDIEDDLAAPLSNEYGRVDQGSAWMLLAKLYLNAEVYVGQDRHADALAYSEQVINGGYALEPDYQHLFLADNNTADGIILPIISDGVNTRAYGNTTFLAHAAVGTGDNFNPATLGLNGGWGGLRTTSALVNLFDLTQEDNERNTFYTDGQTLEINDLSTFAEGYAVLKYKNITSTGEVGSDPALDFVDIDYPLFRLADAYLMYAEAALRGGGGDLGAALGYVNALRERAYNSSDENISAGELTLDFILDERARELYWEGHRRTDLIRFGRFTGSQYVWPWKGGAQEGAAIADFRAVYPLPASDLTANPNLEQNPGY